LSLLGQRRAKTSHFLLTTDYVSGRFSVKEMQPVGWLICAPLRREIGLSVLVDQASCEKRTSFSHGQLTTDTNNCYPVADFRCGGLGFPDNGV
jgi:hypothetical protein